MLQVMRWLYHGVENLLAEDGLRSLALGYGLWETGGGRRETGLGVEAEDGSFFYARNDEMDTDMKAGVWSPEL